MTAAFRTRAATAHRIGSVLLLALLSIRCYDAQLQPYSDVGDREAMQRIERTWTAQAGALGLTLCQHPDDAQVEQRTQLSVEHVVHKDREPYETPRERTGGCGGELEARVVAYVIGTVKGPLAEVAVEGYVVVGYQDDDDAYGAFPYEVDLFRRGSPGNYISGTIAKDGTFTPRMWPIDLSASVPPGMLLPGGAAVCP